MNLPFHITIADTESGEIWEFNISRNSMEIIRRALKAYRSAPQWMAERFDWRHRLPQRSSNTEHQYSGAPGHRFGD